MARGRKAQPAELAAAKGNPGKRAIRTAGVVDAPEIADGAPAELSGEGKKVWARLRPHLAAMKLLRATDQPVFARYCDALGDYWKATRTLRKRGMVYEAPMTNGGKMRRLDPLFHVQERLHKRLVEMEDRLGLSPRARQEILHRLSQAAAPAPALPLDRPGDHATAGELSAERGPVGFLN